MPAINTNEIQRLARIYGENRRVESQSGATIDIDTKPKTPFALDLRIHAK
jgi:hypothetical protein